MLLPLNSCQNDGIGSGSLHLLCKISRLTDDLQKPRISCELGSTVFVGAGAFLAFGNCHNSRFMVLVFMCSLPRTRFRPIIGTAGSRHPLPKDGSPPLLLWLHSDVKDYMDTATVTIVTDLRFTCRVTRVSRVTELLRFGEPLACPMWPARREMRSITRTTRVTPAMVQERQ